MGKKVNISKIEGLLKKAGLENGELDELMQPVKDLNNQRRYGLVWEEPDNETFEKDFAEVDLSLNFPFISELKDKEIYHGEDHPDHLLIEGDNLHALQMMQYTHKNKVDVIYIDPPYNTGNTDFVYNDKIVDSEDSWRHSKWLSFMDKRLRLARELMTDDGVIFISIDDNEMAQLKLLMDQIFGEENFVRNIIWHSNKSVLKQSKTIRKDHEYIVTYAKNRKGMEFRRLKNDMVFTNPDRDPKGAWFSSNATTSLDTSSDRYFGIELPSGDVCYRTWKFSEEEFKQGVVNLYLKGSNVPRLKVYESEYNRYTKIPSSILSDHGTTTSGINKIRNKGLTFDYPKPVDLIKFLVNLHTGNDIIVLDFFAGSGTTGESILELNEEDGGNRQAILVTNNEVADKEERDKMVELGLIQPFTGSRRGTIKHREWLADIEEFKSTDAYQDFINSDDYKDLGIARAVTYPRNQKVIDGYTTPKGKDIDGLYRNNFRHFVIELVEDLQDDNLNAYHLIEQTTDIIRLKESVYSNVEFVDVDDIPFAILSNKYTEIFVILDSMVFDEDIEKIIATYSTEGQEKVLYSNYDKFNYSDHNIRFEELPKELLQAIKQKEVE